MEVIKGSISLDITNVHNPDCMVAREIPGVGMSDEAKLFHDLNADMIEHFSHMSVKSDLSRVEPGQVYIGKRYSDQLWYRIRVNERIKQRTYMCEMLDIGIEEPFHQDSIYDPPNKYLKLPFQAKTYALAGILPLTLTSGEDLNFSMRPASVWDSSTRTFILERLKETPNPKAEVMFHDEKGVPYVRLFVRKDFSSTTCLNDILIEKGYGYTCTKEEKLAHQRSKRAREKICSDNLPDEAESQHTAAASIVNGHNKFSLNSQVYLVNKKPEPDMTWTPDQGKDVNGSPDLSLGSSKESNRSISPAPCWTGGRGRAVMKFLQETSVGRGACGIEINPTALGRGTGRGRGAVPRLSDSGTSEDERRISNRNNSCSSGQIKCIPPVNSGSLSLGVQSISTGKCRAGVTGESRLPDYGTSEDEKGCYGNKPAPSSDKQMLSGVKLPGPIQVNKAIPIPKWTASDSDSGTIGRLPSFVKQTKRGSTDKTKEVTFSDGEELLRPREPVCRVSTSPKSILKVRSDSEASSTLEYAEIPGRSTLGTTQPGTRNSRPPVRSSDERSSRDSSPEEEFSQIKLKGCYGGGLTSLMSGALYSEKPPQPTASELRVLVDGQTPPQHIPQPSDIFGASICDVLDRYDITPTTVQKFSWHTFMRGRNFVAVSCPYRADRGGGTTFAYLIPLLQNLLQKSQYSGVPAGVGPLGLILCSSWRRVHTLFNQVEKLLGKDLFVRTVEIYGGGSESNQEVNLVNGCDLLIATPTCLLRFVERGVVELKRICHLIFDDGDNLIEKFNDEIKDLMGQYTDTLKALRTRSAPQQLMVATAHWAPGLGSFLNTYMTDAGVIVASMAEATIYAEVVKVVHVLEADNRATKLADLLTSCTQKRTLIFANCPYTARAVHEIVMNYGSNYCLLLHEDIPYRTQKETIQEWKRSTNSNSPLLMVVTDEVSLDLEDAEVVIHYDPPKKKQEFGSRLWCMNKNFKLPLNPSEERKGAASILLVTEDWKNYVNLVIKDLKNSSMVIPDALIKLADSIKSSNEKGKYTELCHSLKAYGFCGSENRCTHRHMIQRDLDLPGNQVFHQALPTRGQVKVFVTYVRDATCFWVRLIEHRDQGKITDHSKDFIELAITLPTHYSREENRVPCYTPKVGDLGVIKDLQQNYSRVKVLKIRQHIADRHCPRIEKIQVQMLDVGRVVWIGPNDLMVLHPKFAKYPYQAVEVFVCDVKPFDRDEEWTNQATDEMTAAVATQELEGRIVLTLGNSLWLDPVVKREVLKEVGVITHDVVCHRQLLDNDFAVPNPDHMRMLYNICRGQIDLPDILSLKDIPNMAYDINGLPTSLQSVVPKVRENEGGVCVEVTAAVHPGLFYVRLVENSKKLQQLTNEMINYLKLRPLAPESLEKIEPGCLVLTTFPYDENDEERPWYRGKVMDVVEDQYDVFFLDTGESEYVEKNQVRPMPVTFNRWPFQAMECSLANLLPPSGDTWSEDQGDIMWNMVTDEDNQPRTLLMEVVSKGEARHFGTHQFNVRLFDIELEFDVDIIQELIVGGHGRPSKELVYKEIPGLYDGQTCDIPGLCADILLDKTKASVQTTAVQRSVVASMKDINMLCETRAIGAICQTIGYLNNAVITEVLCKCIALLVRKNTDVVDALLRDNCITIFCRMLSRKDAFVQKVAAWTVAQLVNVERLRKTFIECGALRVLAARLEDPENIDYQAKDHVVQALKHLSKYVSEDCRVLVSRSECIQALSHHLETATDRQVNLDTVDTLRQFIANVSLQEESRRWTLSVFCEKLKEYEEDVEMADHFTSALITLMEGSRINKEALLKFNMLDLLKRLVRSGKLSDEVRDRADNLCDNLSALSRASETAASQEPQLGAASVAKTEASQGNTKPQNKPLPQEELGTIKHSMRPEIKWFQDRRNLILFVQVKNAGDPLDVNLSEDTVGLRAVVERVEYSFNLRLYELIDPNKCVTCVKTGRIEIGLRKKTKGNWPRVIKDKCTLPHLVPDFDHFIDESDSDSENDNENDSDDKHSPLDTIERCKPRPPGLPPPTAEHRKRYEEGAFLPYDPLNDESHSSEDDDRGDDPDMRDDHELDMDRNFFAI